MLTSSFSDCLCAGISFVRCGLLREAGHYFKLCLSIDSRFLRAARNLENVSNLAVERWHFRMLNDQNRNEAYREAIIKKTQEGYDKVLDVGTGTGIMSLFSWEGRAKEIYACDSSHTMIKIAEEVFENNSAVGIKLIEKHSTDLRIPEDLSSRVSLLVTETFDAGLLGEGILSTLVHAWNNLLLPSAAVIPCGATLYLTGVECDVTSNDVHLKTGGFYDYIRCNIRQSLDDYDTLDLKETPFRYLTNVEKILTIDFSSLKVMSEVLKGQHDREMILMCTKHGNLGCFAVWFDLALDEDIVLNTGPESKTNFAWDQAIFPLSRSRKVKRGEGLKVLVSLKEGKLNVKLVEERCDELEASEVVIKMLNDEKLVNELDEVGRKLSLERSARVLDCFPFPVFGFSFLKRRRESFEDKLTCFVQSESDRTLIMFLAKEHDISIDCKVGTEFESLQRGEMFDVILINPVEWAGELKDGILSQLEYLTSFLKPSGVILPESVTLMGQLIHSRWLVKASRVINDTVTCGYRIGKFINVYEVTHFIDINSRNIEKEVCSEPLQLLCLLKDEEKVTQIRFPCLSLEMPPNALLYWFKIKFLKGCAEFETNEERTRYHQAAFLSLKNNVGNEVRFNVIRNEELFSIQFLPS